jgi:hypothetical protein
MPSSFTKLLSRVQHRSEGIHDHDDVKAREADVAGLLAAALIAHKGSAEHCEADDGIIDEHASIVAELQNSRFSSLANFPEWSATSTHSQDYT